MIFNAGMLNDVPDTIIQVEPMVKILTDIHLVEANMQELKTDSMRAHKNEIIASDYLKIMAMHHVDYEQFKSSYDYYSQHPLIMNYIYKEVTQRLSLLESKKQIE